jgi:hypothetical protein
MGDVPTICWKAALSCMLLVWCKLLWICAVFSNGLSNILWSTLSTNFTLLDLDLYEIVAPKKTLSYPMTIQLLFAEFLYWWIRVGLRGCFLHPWLSAWVVVAKKRNFRVHKGIEGMSRSWMKLKVQRWSSRSKASKELHFWLRITVTAPPFPFYHISPLLILEQRWQLWIVFFFFFFFFLFVNYHNTPS